MRAAIAELQNSAERDVDGLAFSDEVVDVIACLGREAE